MMPPGLTDFAASENAVGTPVRSITTSAPPPVVSFIFIRSIRPLQSLGIDKSIMWCAPEGWMLFAPSGTEAADRSALIVPMVTGEPTKRRRRFHRILIASADLLSGARVVPRVGSRFVGSNGRIGPEDLLTMDLAAAQAWFWAVEGADAQEDGQSWSAQRLAEHRAAVVEAARRISEPKPARP